MYHFFVTPEQVEGNRITVAGSDVSHMRQSLRLRTGEQLEISDGNNCRYLCRLEGYEGEGADAQAVLSVLEQRENDTELPSKIWLFQGLPKQDKMELIVQKAVELGAHRIVPVAMRRCVVRLDEKKAEKKAQRWQEIARSAAKQSGRGYIPGVDAPVSWEEALALSGQLDVILIPYELAEGMEQTKEIIRAIRPGQSVGIFIGPEGGFEKEEVQHALEAGAQALTLGRRILRTETAGLALLSVLMFHLEGE